MSDMTDGLRIKFLKLKEAFESKSFGVNLEKTKAASQRMAFLRVKFNHVGSAAWE